jgi:Protein of unknown function (DUF3592)
MASMLIEMWERLRGYNKWVETQATVKSSIEQKTEQYYRGEKFDVFTSDDQIVWTDTNGEQQTGEFTAGEDSELFQLLGDEKITIRYNPAHPSQFYLPKMLESKIRQVGKIAVLSLIFVFVLALFTVFPDFIHRP